MEKNPSEKQILSDDDQSKSLVQKIYSFFLTNWLAFFFALIITVLTIVVVPIIYTLDTGDSKSTTKVLSWNITGITKLNGTTFKNQTNQPLGNISALEFDSGTLYILDKTYGRIITLNELNQANIIFDSNNRSDGFSLNNPNDIFVSSEPTYIYIADTFNHRILRFKTEANPTIIFGTTGKSGNGDGELNLPMSITMGSSSTIYIADYGNNRIIEYNLNTTKSQIYLELKSDKERHQYVLTPISIKYDVNSNSLVIAQEYGYNVIRWIINSSAWTLIAGSASSDLSGTSRTLFNRLCDIDIDSQNNTYVDDCYNQRIQFYNGDLTKGRTIAGVILAIGNNSYIFNTPSAIKLDKDNNIYVADTLNYRIQFFKAL